MGHDYAGHDYIGHNYIGHNSIGHRFRTLSSSESMRAWCLCRTCALKHMCGNVRRHVCVFKIVPGSVHLGICSRAPWSRHLLPRGALG